MKFMRTGSGIDFERLWNEILSNFKGNPRSIHGPAHWRRVEENGVRIAVANGASIDVVRLFAVLHDSCRIDDSFEFEHGERAAEYAKTLRGRLFEIEDEAFALLTLACSRHTFGEVSDNPTVGACWDADRLDLTRIGRIPDPRFLSTLEGKKIAARISRNEAIAERD